MSTWVWIWFAGITAYATKLAGYLVPRKLLAHRAVPGITAALTVGLLAALVMSNTFAAGQTLILDSRALALVAAIIAVRLRVPFIGIVIIGALVVALGRLAGLA
jgi:uncharacterized membrane protein